MSLHRYAPKRDKNEPAIRKRFAHHGWHTEQLSGAGMPDLLVWGGLSGRGAMLVDVKMPGGTVTDPQKKKWGELHDKGIPVYVVRTAEDVDALVRGELLPWRPWDEGVRGMEREAERGARPGQVTPRGKGMRPPENGSDRLKPCGCKRSLGRCEHSGNYTPPRKGDAAKARAAGALKALEAAGYIPPRSKPVGRRCSKGCGKHGWDTTNERTWICADCGQPPDPTPMDATKETEETFAPPLVCNWGHSDCCLVHPGDRP